MDNKENIGSPDRDRVNVHEAYELQYWTERFGVSAEDLKNAVQAVGTSARDVEAHLKK